MKRMGQVSAAAHVIVTNCVAGLSVQVTVTSFVAEGLAVCPPSRCTGTDGMAVDDDDVEGYAALHRELRAQHKQQQLQDEEEYPDEVDVPTDVPGRVRFQKYRWAGDNGGAMSEHWLWVSIWKLAGAMETCLI